MYSTIYYAMPGFLQPFTQWIMLFGAIVAMVILSITIHLLFIALNNQLFRMFVHSYPQLRGDALHVRNTLNTSEYLVQGVLLFLQVYFWMDADFTMYADTSIMPDTLRHMINR